MPLQAVWLSIFHSIASFNNAGFDALGGGTNLIPYRGDVLLNIVTDALVIVGGIGFMVILDVGRCRGNFRKMTFHTKVVLTTTAVLLFGGAALLQITDHLDFMTAFFQSMTARTAGFSTVDLSGLSSAGLLVIMVLMFVGASPGSTGGGIKTTTFCADAAGAVDLLQAQARRIPPPSAGRLTGKGCHHHLDGPDRCELRYLRALHSGAGDGFPAPAV